MVDYNRDFIPNPNELEGLIWRKRQDGGIECVRNNLSVYIIDGDRLGEDDWIEHLLGKSWVDMNVFIPIYMDALKAKGIKVKIPCYN